jgi:hypothetical protein
MKTLTHLRRCSLRLTSAFCSLFLTLLAPPLQAAPFANRLAFTQPSGETIELWGQGDEFSAVF